MSEILDYWQQTMFEDSDEPISSQESGDGLTHSDSQDTKDPAGPQAFPVSRSRTPGKGKRKKTKDIFGPFSDNSWKSADLQQSLENRLRQRLEGIGSLEYALTSKRWDMKSGPPIYALRASGRRDGFLFSTTMGMVFGKKSESGHHISDKDFSGVPIAGYPTPNAHQIDGDPEKILKRRELLREKWGNNGFGLNLGQFAATQIPLQGWPKTPCASDGEGGTYSPDVLLNKSVNPKTKLRDWALMAGWPTAQARDWKGPQGRSYKGEVFDLPAQAQMAGWATPLSNPANGTPEAFLERKRKSVEKTGASMGIVLSDLQMQAMAWTPGPTQSSSPASTGKRGVLDAAFSRWLMGYPESWDKASPSFDLYEKAQALIAEDDSRDTETPSSPKLPPSS